MAATIAANKLLLPCGWREKGFPYGFRFRPTEKELVHYYLQAKVNGTLSYNAVVKDLDDHNGLYSKEPWKIFDKEMVGYFYVFTKLKKKGKAQIERKAGSGTWKGENTKRICDSEGNVRYVKKDFVFKEGKKRKDFSSCSSLENNNGHWNMCEFSLKNEGFDGNYVLCRIWNKQATQKEQTVDPEIIAPLLKKRKLPSFDDNGGGEEDHSMRIRPCHESRENNSMIKGNELALVAQPEQRNYSNIMLGSQFLMAGQTSSSTVLPEYGDESEFSLAPLPEQRDYLTPVSGSRFLMAEHAASSQTLFHHGQQFENLPVPMPQLVNYSNTTSGFQFPVAEHPEQGTTMSAQVLNSYQLPPLAEYGHGLQENFGIGHEVSLEGIYCNYQFSASDYNTDRTSLFADIDGKTRAAIDKVLDKFLKF